MSDQPAGRPHYRIYSQVTPSAFLHVEDALAIGKLRLFAGKYEKGQGASATAHHYLDLDDARLLFTDLAAGKVPVTDEKDQAYVEYKGSGEGIPVSRILKVQARQDRVFFELSYGPGEYSGEGLGAGAVRPVRGAQRQSVTVALSWLEARKMALAVLAHLTAWEIATFPARIATRLAQQAEEMAERRALAAAPQAEEEAPPAPARPAAPAPPPAIQPTPEAVTAPPSPEPERADATAYWQLANSEAARKAVDPAQIKDWALKAQQYNRWDLAIRRLKEAIARSQ
jgi:hypothetical protein